MTDTVRKHALAEISLTDETVEPGVDFDCPVGEVEYLERVGAIREPNARHEPDGADVSVEAVSAAILTLDRAKPTEQFTLSGKPTTDVLSEIVGQPVSGKLRDEAWEAVKDEFEADG